MYNWGSVFGCSPFTFAGQSVWIVLLLYIRRRQIMTFNAMTEHYEEITVCGKPALFTSIRIKRDTVPPTMSGMMMSAGASLVRSRPL